MLVSFFFFFINICGTRGSPVDIIISIVFSVVRSSGGTYLPFAGRTSSDSGIREIAIKSYNLW